MGPAAILSVEIRFVIFKAVEQTTTQTLLSTLFIFRKPAIPLLYVAFPTNPAPADPSFP